MFALKIDNTALDVSPDAEVGLVLSCPLFDRERIVRTFSLPFTLPLTPRNQRALAHVNRFDSSEAWGEHPCSLWSGAGTFDTGELLCTGSGPDALEVAFRNLPVTVAEDLKRIFINEILDTLSIPDTGPAAEIQLDITTPPFAYDITIGGINYTLGIGGSSGMTTSDVGVYFRDLINADYPGMATSNTTQLILDSALVNAATVDWSVMTGFTIASYVTTGQSAQQSFLNYAEGVAATPADELLFPMMAWEGLYEGKNAIFQSVVNPIFDGEGLENTEDEDETRFEWTYIPCVRVPYILDKIIEAAGIGYRAGWFTDNADALAMFTVNNLTCDQAYRDWYADELFKYLNGYVQEINLNKHVPKMTALDFLMKLCGGLNLILEYKEGGLHFTKALDLVAAPPVSWDGYATNAYKIALRKPVGATLRYPDNDREGFTYSTQLDKYVLGEGSAQMEMPFLTMQVNNGFILGHGTFRAPHTKQLGKSPIFSGNVSDLPLTLLFDRGAGATSEAESYPFATLDELGDDEATTTGGLSLVLDGTYGLVAQMYGSMLGYGDLADLDVTAVVPEGELYRLRRWENARVRFYHPNGMVTMVLRAVEFSLAVRAADGWVEVKARGLKE